MDDDDAARIKRGMDFYDAWVLVKIDRVGIDRVVAKLLGDGWTKAPPVECALAAAEELGSSHDGQ